MLLEHVEELGDDGDAVFADDYALHLDGADSRVPVMLTNVSYRDTLSRICVENLFNKIFAVYGERRWDCEVASKNLLIQFICVRVFKGQEAAGHGVEDDAAGPDIRSESVILLTGNHFRSCIARASTGSLQKASLSVGI